MTRGTPGITPKAALIRVLTIRPIQASWFAPSFLLAVSVGQIAQGIADITAQLGPYARLTPLPDGGYRVQCRDGTVEGRIHLDSQGRIDGRGVQPLQRENIRQPISTSVRAIDGLHTCGLGQRMGIFSGPGVGKSTLLSGIARDTSADVSVVARNARLIDGLSGRGSGQRRGGCRRKQDKRRESERWTSHLHSVC